MNSIGFWQSENGFGVRPGLNLCLILNPAFKKCWHSQKKVGTLQRQHVSTEWSFPTGVVGRVGRGHTEPSTAPLPSPGFV